MSTIIYLLFFTVSCHSFVDIEKYLPICDRSKPDVNDCMVDAIREGLATLTDGIKDLGVPPVDPYHQKELRVMYKNNQIMAKMVLKDIYVHGLKAAKVHDARLRADEDRFYLEVDLTSPRIFVEGLYDAEGSYNSLQVIGSGAFNTTMTDVVYTWKLEGSPEKKGNETYIRIHSFYMRPDVGNLKTHMSNDNRETSDIINLGTNFANANWKILYRELLPIAQDNWKRIGIRVANKIFLKVPYEQLFPYKS